MRTIIIFLIFFFFSSLPVSAMDVVLGRISSVDSETGKIMLDVTDFHEAMKADDEKSGLITIVFPEKVLPAGIQKGDLIRVWGTYHDGKVSPYFDAKQITMENKNADCDPTGVRQRLRKGMGMGGGKWTRGHGNRHND